MYNEIKHTFYSNMRLKMSKEVIIKSNKFGIKLILDNSLPFEDLLHKIEAKFKEMDDFFKDSTMTITFDNRVLTRDEEKEIVDVIMKNSHIIISAVVGPDKHDTKEQAGKKKRVDNELFFSTQNDDYNSQNNSLDSNEPVSGFYKGNLRSGQVLECKSSVTIIGDVNPGAKVISGGNIVILGSLKGNAHAGAQMDDKEVANRECFIFALEMKPIQLQIGDLIAKCPDKDNKGKRNRKKERQSVNTKRSQIAIVKDGYIYIEPMTKGSLS